MSGGIRLRPYIHIYDVHRNNSVIRIWFNDRFCIHGDEKKINIICSMHCDYNNPYLPTNAHNLYKIIHNLHTSVIESFILVGTCYMLQSFHFTSIYTKCTALIFNSVACLFFFNNLLFFLSHSVQLNNFLAFGTSSLYTNVKFTHQCILQT